MRKALPVLAALAASACDDAPPTGQVLAKVGGAAITQRDIDADSEAADGRAGAGNRSARLERAIDQTLMIQLARDARLDVTPDYLATRRRGEAAALIALYRRHVAARLPQPTTAEIETLIAQRPWMFARRAQLVLDQLDTERAADLARSGPGSLAAIAAGLTARRIAFERTAAVVDTGALPDVEGRLLVDLPPGRPVAIPGRGRIVAIVSRIPAPITGDVARKVADAVLARMRVDDELARLTAMERARTAIRYRADLAPALR